MRGFGLGFTNPVGTGGVLDVCLCLGCSGACRLDGEWVGGLDQGLEGWCYVCVRCESGFSVYWQVQVSVYCAWRISAHLRYTQCSILFHLMDICFLRCICLWQISQIHTCRTWICLDNIILFFRSSAKNGKSGLIAGAGGFKTIIIAVCDSSTACRLCHLEPLPQILQSRCSPQIHTKPRPSLVYLSNITPAAG